MEEHKDLPVDQFIKEMDKLIQQGLNVFVKFTCQHCGSRQTDASPNVLFSEGYTCEECKKTSFPDKFGMMVMAGAEMGKMVYDPTNPEDWEGTNIQSYSRELPKETEREMIIYLNCVSCRTIKPFTITDGLGDFFVRKTKFVEYGSMCMYCFKKSKVRLEWMGEPSWKFFKKDEERKIVPKMDEDEQKKGS